MSLLRHFYVSHGFAGKGLVLSITQFWSMSVWQQTLCMGERFLVRVSTAVSSDQTIIYRGMHRTPGDLMGLLCADMGLLCYFVDSYPDAYSVLNMQLLC
jgi:hypothetical protein